MSRVMWSLEKINQQVTMVNSMTIRIKLSHFFSILILLIIFSSCNKYKIEKLKNISKIEKSKKEYKIIVKQFNDSLYKWNKMKIKFINAYFQDDWIISDIFFNSKRNRFIMIILKVNNDDHPFDTIELVAGEYKARKLHFYMRGLTSFIYSRAGYDQHNEDRHFKKFTNKNDMRKMRNYILDELIDGGIFDGNKINDKWINDWYLYNEIPTKNFYIDTL